MNRYTIKTFNDTGDQQWEDEYQIFANSDEEAKDISLTRWLECRLGIAAEAAELFGPSGRLIDTFSVGA